MQVASPRPANRDAPPQAVHDKQLPLSTKQAVPSLASTLKRHDGAIHVSFRMKYFLNLWRTKFLKEQSDIVPKGRELSMKSWLFRWKLRKCTGRFVASRTHREFLRLPTLIDHLQSLTITGNHNLASKTKLLSVLSQLTSLTTLELRDNAIRSFELKFVRLTKLKSLDLRNNELTCIGGHRSCSFKDLLRDSSWFQLNIWKHFSSACDQSKPCPAFIKQLKQCLLASSPQRIRFLLKGLRSTLESCRKGPMKKKLSFKQCIKLQNYLRDLKFDRDLILGRVLRQLPSLTKLDLGRNHLNYGCRYLAEPLSRLTLLKSLSLDRNALDCADFKHICTSVACLKALTYLDLSHNGLRSSHVPSLCSALSHLTSLHALFLEGNSFSPGNVAEFCDAFSSQGRMKYSRMKYFLFDDDCKPSDVTRSETWVGRKLKNPPMDLLQQCKLIVLKVPFESNRSGLNFAPLIHYLANEEWENSRQVRLFFLGDSMVCSVMNTFFIHAVFR